MRSMQCRFTWTRHELREKGTIMNMVLKAARVTRSAGSFGVNVVFPVLGIPRPFNYLAGTVWLCWLGAIAYNIITR